MYTLFFRCGRFVLELHSFFPPPLHMIQAHLEQYIRISWKLSVE